uniref:Uncharacterized protein n=1 Tax=Pyxicephalus adspersus TaxID=30357 RepID=A0AAV2ZDV8_PYXAD|nr:TPA: hypothetical protein GDO54_004915 [Pyxicephalus adspersus]
MGWSTLPIVSTGRFLVNAKKNERYFLPRNWTRQNILIIVQICWTKVSRAGKKNCFRACHVESPACFFFFFQTS